MSPRAVYSVVLLAGLVQAESGAWAAVGFTRGPFVQNATTNSIQIIWRTSQPGTSFVEYGPTNGPLSLITNAALETNHVITLGDLEPGKTYQYRVGSECAGGSLISRTETFRSFRSEGPVRFVVFADTCYGYLPTVQLAAVLHRLRLDPDLALDLGDVASGFTDAGLGFQFFSPFERLVPRIPFYFIPGNHDFSSASDSGAATFQNALYLPTNSATGTKLFYSFDHGDAHFVCLANTWPYSSEFALTATNAQFGWLTNDLATSTKPWKLLFTHTPLACSGPHAGEGDSTLALLVPVAQQYGVQMVFSGHDHSFERFAPTNGLHHCVAAGGGQPLYGNGTPQIASAQFWSAYHFVRVGITNDMMTIEAIGIDGVVFDSMTVQKALPSPQLHQATWNTPTIMSGPANDGDGNVIGQTFDLASTPIRPRAGQFSNLGRVYVNNDATTLYVGFEQVMMYPNNNVFLFIESPRQTGVTTMAGVGNGIIDPDGQGADGLDCLENLSFTGFAPGIGCILGDEYGDGQFRRFVRSNLALNLGQGVFRLDSSLSDVSRARLQQFNRSPQKYPFPPYDGVTNEQSADFIEIAIPFSELGGVQPGDTIKLGAVVGGAAFDPVAQTRDLDTSVLGYSMIGSGMSNVVLEGVSVRLATEPAHPLLTIAPVASSQYRLSWNAEVGAKYEIEFSTDLNSFTPLSGPGLPITAAATNESIELTAPGSAAVFYRLRVVP